MKPIVQQTGLLSTQPLRGYYRYKDLFQIFPSATQNLSFQQDHPLILEICYFPEVWPHRDQLLWHRDFWERERFEYIREHSPKKELNPSDEWVKAYQSQTMTRRLPAIIAEVSGLLTLFNNHRFFTYHAEQHWFIPIPAPDKDDAPRRSLWGQLGYVHDALESGADLSEPTCPEVTRVPIQKYYARFRDAIYAGEDNTVQLPESIDQLFDLYFKLHPDRKTGLHTACYLYNRALELRTTCASLSLVAAVMAIEALVNCSGSDAPLKVCEECRTPESIEKCSVCGLPRFRATSRFKQFLSDFGSEDLKKFANDLYKTRSKLAHGGLLRDDLHDSGFYAREKDEERMFRMTSLSLVRIAMLNWLIKS